MDAKHVETFPQISETCNYVLCMYFIFSLNDFEMFVAPSQDNIFLKTV